MKKIYVLALTVLVISCNKNHYDYPRTHQVDASLVKDWIAIQLRLIRNTTGVTHVAYSRPFAYSGVAMYASILKADRQNKTGMPDGEQGAGGDNQSHKSLYGPIAANAAMATTLRFFYGSKFENRTLIDSLEKAYFDRFASNTSHSTDEEASVQLGNTVATQVVEWSKLDGSSQASIPYTPRGTGYWEPTAPAYAAAAVPGWGNNQTILAESFAGVNTTAPLPFSIEPNSSFYLMVKEVLDISRQLTAEQKAIATYWDDAPNGKYLTVFGHWFNILRQALDKKNLPLNQAALAYLQLGISMNDAGIYCWKTKFTFHQIRPITYIRKYMGDENWNSFITTPAHPEYLAAHATLSGAAAAALTAHFGRNFAFTDHSYDELGMQPRSFQNFEAAALEAGNSRIYGGIHYRPSVMAGLAAGKSVANNVDRQLKLPFHLLVPGEIK